MMHEPDLENIHQEFAKSIERLAETIAKSIVQSLRFETSTDENSTKVTLMLGDERIDWFYV